MKKIIGKTFAIALCVSALTITASASVLTGIRANNAIDHTRVVLELQDRSPYWDVKYNDTKDKLSILLPKTANGLTKPITYSKNGKLLKGVLINQTKNKELAVSLMTNQPVMSNIFTLDKPERLVIDIFTNYDMKTARQLTKSISFMKWITSIEAGRVKAVVITNVRADNVVLLDAKKAHTLAGWYKREQGHILLPMEERERQADIFMQKAYLASRTKGLDILFVQPKFSAYMDKKIFPISRVNRERNKDELILYTPDYGLSTKTNIYGMEIIVKNGKVIKIGKGNSTIPSNGYVLSGHGKMIALLHKIKVGDSIGIKEDNVKLSFNPDDTIRLPGEVVLKNGQYVGTKRGESDDQRMSRSFVGVNNKGQMVLVAIEGGTSDSVGVTLEEGGRLLKKLNIISAVAIEAGNDTQLAVNGVEVVDGSKKGQEYSKLLLLS